MVQLQRDAVELAQNCPLNPAAAVGGRMQCLIVAADESRRRDLSDAATRSGWRTYQTAELDEALACLRRLRVQMAIVDMTSVGERSQQWLRSAVEQVATEELLTVVCGGSCEPAEEIWARQLGVWMYLPGVIDPHDLHPILGEARDLAGRLTASRGSAMAGAGAE